MRHGSILDVYIFVLVLFNGFFLAFGVISFAKLHKQLPKSVLSVLKYVLIRNYFQKILIIVVNMCCFFGYLYALFNQHSKDSYNLYGIFNGVILLTFLYSYAINFSYRFHVNNKNFDLTASDLDRKTYKINNVILAISLTLIVLFKYF